jgi:hypothetical protein
MGMDEWPRVIPVPVIQIIDKVKHLSEIASFR